MTARSTVLELAVLGLAEEPIHGYEIRRKLLAYPAAVGSVSHGLLYPMLQRLTDEGLLTTADKVGSAPVEAAVRRRRINYTITPDGSAYLARRLPLLPATDDIFALQLVLLPTLPSRTRTAILVARSDYLRSRREELRDCLDQTQEDGNRDLAAHLFMRLRNIATEIELLQRMITGAAPTPRTGKLAR